MNDEFLKSRLQRVARRFQWLALWRKLAVCWAVAALVGVVVAWMQGGLGLVSPLTLPVVVALAAATALVLVVTSFLQEIDYRWVARKVENKHPDLDGVLLTAVQQQTTELKDQGYLQYRVLQEATRRSQEQDWNDVVPGRRLFIGQLVHLVALACFVTAVLNLRVAPVFGEAPRWISGDGISIQPGDTKIEKGDSLVVLARFGGTLPPTVNLVVQENGATARTVPLVKSLADPVFGGSVTEVQNDLTYRLEYRGQKSRDFKVTVYEHPRLVRSDVDLKFPNYTKLAPKHIEDTRRVSAVEGTKLDFALQLNKPVKSARLVARDQKKTVIPLTVSADKAVATLSNFVPQKSQSYDLQLVDDEGRPNKIASPFVIDVQPNRPPEIRLASPRGDVRPSALEEVVFDGTVWDDFGISAYGLAYAIGGGEPKFIELGRDAAAKEKKAFNHLLKLEELGAKPDDLVSWYVWADDVGPDGKTRRTNGDLYFGEVRPFDEIFREAQNMESGEDDDGGQGNEARKLTELQKQIINATWKLQRTGKTPKYIEDEKVIADAQQQALSQAQEAAEEARSPRQQALWKSATQQMEKALEKLRDAAVTPEPLAQALPAEQAAYQDLLKLQPRETQVTRRNRNQRGGGGGGNQRQIEQLDLAQAENRYETQRQAKAPQNKERREQLAVMNRLQELARRQQDLNERLKELQTALQEAQSEKEKEDIKRRLKRLEEEQRQMLADADELRQRMDRAENQSNLAQQRQQLEQTREDLQKAAEATADGSVAQALASGTRAQRQLQEMRDELRKQNSSQFSDDLREMRSEARELANKQDEIGQKLDSLAKGGEQQRKSLSDSGDRKDLQDQLTVQKERMNKLLDRAQQISEQSENTEPLLSRQLYDSIRKVSQDDANAVKEMKNELMSGRSWSNSLIDRLQKAGESDERGKALDLANDMLREGYLPQARQAGQRARAEIDELRRGVERAAESVLGDDAEQLKLAQSELDSLTDQLKREIAQSTGNDDQKGEQQNQSRDGQRRGQQPGQGDRDQQQAQAGEQQGRGEQRGQQPGEQPGQRGDRSQQTAGNDQQQRPQNGQGGQQPGQQQQSQQGQGGQQTAQSQAGGQQGGGEQQSGGRGGRDQVADANERRAKQLRRLQEGGNNERGGFSIDDVLNIGVDRGGGIGGWEGGVWNRGPLTGEEFRLWEQRLRDVEDLIETPELRNALAAARERARIFRRDMKNDLKKPDWTVVQLEIVKPLVEVRNRVAEELARRDNRDSLAPIDRDPVPNRFAESVRRYYEELGKDGREAEAPNQVQTPKSPN